MYTTTEYPPSVLDESARPLPEKDGVAFKNQNLARLALFWWIICTVPSGESRRSWAGELLGGDHHSVVITYKNKVWSTLSRDTNGGFWVE